jgi:hypothetical protein
MKIINTITELEPYVSNTTLLSIDKEEAEVLVQVVKDFKAKNVHNAPKTESLLNAITEIKEKYNNNSNYNQTNVNCGDACDH